MELYLLSFPVVAVRDIVPLFARQPRSLDTGHLTCQGACVRAPNHGFASTSAPRIVRER